MLAIGILVFLALEAIDRSGLIYSAMSCRQPGEPIDSAWRRDQRQGFVLSTDGRYREAEAKHRSALRLVEELYGPEHHQVIAAINAVGVACLMQGDLPEAEVLFLRSLRLSRKTFREGDARLYTPVEALYQIYYETGDYAAAEEYAKLKLRIAERAFGVSDLRFVECLEGLSAVYEEQQAFGQSIPLYGLFSRICGWPVDAGALPQTSGFS